MVDDDTPAGEWESWNDVVASDLADPAFRALVVEADAEQEAWAREATTSAAECGR